MMTEPTAAYPSHRFEDIAIGQHSELRHTVSAADVDAFAALSGDRNPLHLDAAFAAHTPFGQRVVHGMFSAALISAAHTQLTGPGFAYVGQELRFLAPVFIGDTLRITVTVVERKVEKRILVMQTTVEKMTGDVAGEPVVTGRSALKAL